jgi:ABC-type branched-subunit amino acid transport system ATPase component
MTEVSETADSVDTGGGRGFAVRCLDLRHTFGDTVAVNGVDLDVAAGTTFGLLGLLGPNGAGKPPPFG